MKTTNSNTQNKEANKKATQKIFDQKSGKDAKRVAIKKSPAK